MSIKAPNKLKFFIPSTIEKLDQTAEPTIEGIGGEDYLGNALVSTDQVVNAMDGYPKRPFQANTDGVATSFHIDAALEQREKVGFVCIDQHNLRNAYPAATKEQIGIKHYTSDTYASATEETPEKELSGKLGDTGLLFINGNYDNISLSNDDKAITDRFDFTINIICKFDDVASYARVLYPNSSSNGVVTIRRYNFINSNSLHLVFTNSLGSSVVFSNSGIPIDNTLSLYTFAVSWNGDSVTVTHYKNGAYVNGETKSVTGMFNTSVARVIFVNYDAFCEINYFSLFNRELSSDEILNINKRESISLLDQWSSVSDLLADNQATSGLVKSTEGNSVASWTGSNATLSSVTNAEGFDPKYGTYMLKGATTGTPGQARQSFTTVTGKQYRVQAWLRDSDTSSGALTLRVGTSAGDNDLGESTGVTSDDTWTYKQIEFTATGTTTHLSINKVASGATNIYADGVYACQIGCVVELDGSGINKQDGKWYDSSTNNLDGTITGVKYINVPEATDDFYLAELSSEVDARYWFFDFNPDGVTGSSGVDTLIGQIAFGKVCSFGSSLKPEGGYSGDYAFPGVTVQETDAGNFLTEEKFGKRQAWDLTFQVADQDQMDDFTELMNAIKGSKYPFYVCFNYDDVDPVIYRVRLRDSSLGWSYSFGSNQPYTKTIQLVSDEVS